MEYFLNYQQEIWCIERIYEIVHIGMKPNGIYIRVDHQVHYGVAFGMYGVCLTQRGIQKQIGPFW